MQLREDRPADCQRLERLFLAADERGVGLGRQMLRRPEADGQRADGRLL